MSNEKLNQALENSQEELKDGDLEQISGGVSSEEPPAEDCWWSMSCSSFSVKQV
ncbi:hypothetical protein V8J88_22755 [Massilia sp. W12]|uniref:hypothetical protein n=1 Tax=Massilia sp. W12 TaxID=3126507 RepID=UPI0030CB0BF3